MKYFHMADEPISIHGLAVVNRIKRQFWKVPQSVIDEIPSLEQLGKRATGGRVRFQTNSEVIAIKMVLEEAKEDMNLPLPGTAGATIYLGTGENSKYYGYIAPPEHSKKEVFIAKKFELTGNMEVVTINLPRNEHVCSLEIGIEDDAKILSAPDYTISGPIVFYGSSITNGGCATHSGNAYTSMVCRWLDADYINLGFSKAGRGELAMARYINTIPNKSAFVFDYDHHAPTISHLKDTHELFFKAIRDANPDLPIIIMSRPDVDHNIENAKLRKEVILETYNNAKAAGDNNVYFIDGFTLFGEFGREECTIDLNHPNSLGHMRIAERVYPVLKEILYK